MRNTRIAQMQEYLTENQLDAALLALSENIVLMCRQYWSRLGFGFLFVPRNGEATLIIPQPEAEDLPADFGINVRLFRHVELAAGNPYDNIAAILAQLGDEHGICADCRIGIELRAQAVAPALCDGEVLLPGAVTQAMIRSVWSGAELVDILPATMEMRKRKTAVDIEKIERTNRLAYAGIDRFLETLAAGGSCTEIELASMVERYIAMHAGDFGGKYARAWAQVSSGARTEGAWYAGLVTTSRKIADGEPVLLEMGTVLDGYFCDLTICACKKEAKGQIAEMLDLVRRAQQAAIDAIRPGITGKAVDAAARAVIEAAGYGKYFNHGTGHGTGFAYHDGAPALNPTSDDVLEVGMVHSVEPGIYVPGVGGVRLEVNSLVTENGARVLGK